MPNLRLAEKPREKASICDVEAAQAMLAFGRAWSRAVAGADDAKELKKPPRLRAVRRA